MSEKIITSKSNPARLCYVSAFTPRSAKEDGSDPKYSVCVLIPKKDTETINEINRAINRIKQDPAALAKWNNKGKVPAGLSTPLRDGDEERPDDPAFAGMMFLNANSKNKPGIIDADRMAILDPNELYSGCYGRVSFNLYPYNANGNKGIAAGLNNIQKLAEGERLSGGSTAEEDFADDDDDNTIDPLS